MNICIPIKWSFLQSFIHLMWFKIVPPSTVPPTQERLYRFRSYLANTIGPQWASHMVRCESNRCWFSLLKKGNCGTGNSNKKQTRPVYSNPHNVCYMSPWNANKKLKNTLVPEKGFMYSKPLFWGDKRWQTFGCTLRAKNNAFCSQFSKRFQDILFIPWHCNVQTRNFW